MQLRTDVENEFLDALIARAESTVANLKQAAAITGPALWLVEGMIADMYDERRRRRDAMMHLPFEAAHDDA